MARFYFTHENLALSNGTVLALADGSNLVLGSLATGVDYMAITLFDLTYRVARALGVVIEGTATGGSTSTIVDTNNRKEADDYWVGASDDKSATVWLIYDAGGAAAAPQGEFGVVTDFVQSSSTITIRTAVSQAVDTGDRYAISKKRYSLQLITSMINGVVVDMGVIPYSNKTSLDTIGDQTEYTLPIAANMDLREVWIQTNVQTSDNLWQLIPDWQINYSATGTGDTLIIPAHTAGRDLMLVYMIIHPELVLATDKLSERIHPDLIVYEAALRCILTKDANSLNDPAIRTKLEYLNQKVTEVKREHPIRVAPRKSKLFIIGNDDLPSY